MIRNFPNSNPDELVSVFLYDTAATQCSLLNLFRNVSCTDAIDKLVATFKNHSERSRSQFSFLCETT